METYYLSLYLTVGSWFEFGFGYEGKYGSVKTSLYECVCVCVSVSLCRCVCENVCKVLRNEKHRIAMQMKKKASAFFYRMYYSKYTCILYIVLCTVFAWDWVYAATGTGGVMVEYSIEMKTVCWMGVRGFMVGLNTSLYRNWLFVFWVAGCFELASWIYFHIYNHTIFHTR